MALIWGTALIRGNVVIENKIPHWNIYILLGQKNFYLKICMLTEKKWSDRKIYILHENMYSVWKIYATRNHICNLKKYICSSKAYLIFPKTYSNCKKFVARLTSKNCLFPVRRWLKFFIHGQLQKSFFSGILTLSWVCVNRKCACYTALIYYWDFINSFEAINY